jgi:hypothetical protein
MVALLASTHLLTGLDVHPHREVLSVDPGLAGMEGETVSLGAVHPAAAPHMEAAGAEATFRCPLCLVHLQSAGEALGETATAVTPLPDTRLAAPEPALPRATSRLPCGSRAPPTSP